MTTTTRTPLTPTSVGVAEFTADRQRFGPIHRPESKYVTVGATKRQMYKIVCGPPIKGARAVEFADGDTTPADWCRDCWDIGPACTMTFEAGPMSPYSSTARRGRYRCNIHGPMPGPHVDMGTARDDRDKHLRAGGAG